MAINATTRGGASSGRGDDPHFTNIYYHAADARGDGSGNSKAEIQISRADMPALKQRYIDLRSGTNESGANIHNQVLSPATARSRAVHGPWYYQGGQPKMVKDAYGNPL